MKPELTPALKDKVPDCIQILRGVNSIKARDLAKALNVSERELRLIKSYIVSTVSPRITSGDFGYKWEEDTAKVEISINRLHSHGVSEITIANKQRKLLKEEIL